jgi:hypothetical protein
MSGVQANFFAYEKGGYIVDTLGQSRTTGFSHVENRTIEKRDPQKKMVDLHHGIFLFRHLGEKLNTTNDQNNDNFN